MSDDLSQRPIVIKRIKKVADRHHGGAWKIAYADFVTAMMAFFLLMWLLGSADDDKLKGISEYFGTPMKIAFFGGQGVGDRSSIVKGGGADLTYSDGQVDAAINKISDFKVVDLETLRKEQERREYERLNQLKLKIEHAIESNPILNKFKNQLLIDITTEGLRIQIVDEKNRPMFASGRATLQPYTKFILHEIGKMLNDVTNRVSLTGHTDATPFPSGDRGYSNWELSADRANASRRELISGGMMPDKILRVVGLSSAVLFDKENPFNPINRRISIIVMNEKAEKAITENVQSLAVEDIQELNKEATENDEVGKP